ncbi:glutathione binding-like protein [Hyphococcus sp.]|uniref:glutathione binding-like protein n=1 Tax=Hyphococcus sp. TaxID=2038636 RepID=UPI003D0C5446
MIDIYYAATPNGLKLKIFMEETGIEHRIVPVRLGKGEQFKPDFLAISPNNKIPALVDHAPVDGGAPIALFESCAMLAYLGEKTGLFFPKAARAQLEVKQWLMWQAAGLGPMAGQAGHFRAHAADKIAYAIDRYTKETARLYSVLDKRLQGRDFICGEYSVADMAAYPWVVPHAGLGQNLSDFPDLNRWFETISKRPAVLRAYEGVEDPYAAGAKPMSDEEREILFGRIQKSTSREAKDR